jgi:hypothetical protein
LCFSEKRSDISGFVKTEYGSNSVTVFQRKKG